ncbi:MAG: hypothetical protein ACXVCP_01810 [Bdellovibrio sp.]
MDFFKKTIISFFIVIQVTIMVIAGLPDKSAVGNAILDNLYWYQVLFALDQTWSMFAPNPLSKNSYMDAVITFKDKSTEKWTFPRASHLDGWRRFTSGERLRKFQQENLIPKQKMELWSDLGLFLQREINRIEKNGQGRSIDYIEFFSYSSFVKPPSEKFIPHGQVIDDYKKESVFVYKPKEETKI